MIFEAFVPEEKWNIILLIIFMNKEMILAYHYCTAAVAQGCKERFCGPCANEK